MANLYYTRVTASLDGKHLLGFVTKKDYDGLSSDDDDEDSSDSEMSDSADGGATVSSPADYDSQTVDYEPSSDEDASDGEEDAKTSAKPKPSSPTKTMDDTHIRLVKNLTTAYDIFQAICKKYEGAAFHGDPMYYILHFLMETKYEEGSDVNEFFLILEDAMRAASKATESVLTDGQKSVYLFHSMPASWKDDLRIWKGNRKYIPYDELKTSIEDKIRKMEAETRYTLAKGTPESRTTKGERALIAPAQAPARPVTDSQVCSYCQKPRHDIRQCRGL
uniref:Uncharacterized protein n=1 Tax=Phytophthora ramorum TaxID=164328 RepID=H3GSE4_PHYRM